MAEFVRRRAYKYLNVLIESARVLDPQFDPVTIQATGAQVELLRNAVVYLTRTSTYVAEYHPGYYLMPTVEDYDTILAIVADLQNKLMGGSGAMYDYKDRYAEWLGATKSGDGDFLAETDPVPADTVLIVEHAYIQNLTRATDACYITITDDTNEYSIASGEDLLQYQVRQYSGRVTLKEGDYVKVVMNGCLNGDVISAGVWGYTIDVS